MKKLYTALSQRNNTTLPYPISVIQKATGIVIHSEPYRIHHTHTPIYSACETPKLHLRLVTIRKHAVTSMVRPPASITFTPIRKLQIRATIPPSLSNKYGNMVINYKFIYKFALFVYLYENYNFC